ncbi:hypothetical protein ACROYT_G012919 [Oculina patagonica]
MEKDRPSVSSSSRSRYAGLISFVRRLETYDTPLAVKDNKFSPPCQRYCLFCWLHSVLRREKATASKPPTKPCHLPTAAHVNLAHMASLVPQGYPDGMDVMVVTEIREPQE